MHVLIINGSPRVQSLSNTDKIISRLVRGMKTEDEELTYELYSISDRKQWDAAREAFKRNTEILIAIPLYVECIPGLLLEFLDTLEKKDGNTRISFVLQSGFAEASQLRCGEEYLKKTFEEIASMLGCNTTDEACAKLQSLFDSLELTVPTAKEEDYAELKTSVNPVRLKNNPVGLTEAVIESLYREILK